MNDANAAHGSYFRKVLDESRRCALDLLERNNELMGLMARAGQELADLQQQANNLANLYVASYSLHSTLDRGQLVAAIREIVANLIGSEEMALFRLDAVRQRLVLLDSVGVELATYRELPLDRGLVAQAVRSGQPLVVAPGDPRAAGEESLTAVIPLRVVDDVVGAIAIFRLLPQKPVLEDLDRELFDLLASQAGMALHCAELHARLAAVETAAVAGRAMQIDLEPIRRAFQAEVEEDLAIVEQELLVLEKAPEDAERIASVFRKFHSLKGNAAGLGLERLSSFAHRIEDLLDGLRHGSERLTSLHVSFILQVVDALRRVCPAIGRGEDQLPPGADELLAQVVDGRLQPRAGKRAARCRG